MRARSVLDMTTESRKGEDDVTTDGVTTMGERRDAAAEQQRTVYRYTVEGSGQWCVFPTIEQMFETLREDLLAMDIAERFTIAAGEMTDAELEALPDFEGF